VRHHFKMIDARQAMKIHSGPLRRMIVSRTGMKMDIALFDQIGIHRFTLLSGRQPS
jgi:hypothetical protein